MNVLVTAIGSFSADCVISSLKSLNCKVIGCDIYPAEWHAQSKACDDFFQAPFAAKEMEYIDFLLRMSRDNDVNFIFPLTDLEIDVLNKNRDSFADAGIILCMPSKYTLLIARDKYELYETFKNDSLINSITTYRSKVDIISNPSYPYIAKPRNGRSSEGLMRIFDDADLEKVANKENYIIQEFIEGPVYTVDYVRNERTGSHFAVYREELLRTKNGAGTTVRVLNDEILNKAALYVGEKIKVNGCINMEFIKNQGLYYLIDINPRFSAGVAFTKVAGYNMIESHLNCFISKDINEPITWGEQIITKSCREEVLWKA